MKFSLYLITPLLFFMACDANRYESLSPDESLIVGQWKHTESYISSGGPQYWVEAENGEEITFFANRKFTSNRFEECRNGAFSIVENTLLLDYSCRAFLTDIENDEGYITFRIELFQNYLLLTPTSGPICIEGCSYRYERAN